MAIMQNELLGANQAALQNVMQEDAQLRAGQQPRPEAGPNVSPTAITKTLNDLSIRAAANPQDVPGGFQGPSQDMIKMLQVTHNYHQAKQALAQQKLAEMGNQVRFGFYPDPRQMIKLMKQSGMHADTSPEGIAAATMYYKNYYGEQDPVTGQSRGEVPKEIQDMQAKAQAGTLGKRDLARFVMGGMIKNEERGERWAAYSDAQKAALQRRGTELLDQVTSDKLTGPERSNALGNLAVLYPTTIGQMAKHWLDYSAATPEQRANQIAIASGMRSPKEIEDRADSLTNDAISWGMSPTMARQYGSAMAAGKPVPPDVLAAVPKITAATLGQDAALLKTLTDVGIPGSKIYEAVSAYKMGGTAALKGFLPSQTPQEIQQNFQKQMLELDKRYKEGMLGLEGRRVALMEKEEGALTAEREASAAQRKAMAEKYGIAPDSEQAKLLVDMVHIFSGIKNPDAGIKALMTQTENALAPQLGGQLVRKPGWFWREVTEFQPNPELVPNDVIGAPPEGTPQRGPDNFQQYLKSRTVTESSSAKAKETQTQPQSDQDQDSGWDPHKQLEDFLGGISNRVRGGRQ